MRATAKPSPRPEARSRKRKPISPPQRKTGCDLSSNARRSRAPDGRSFAQRTLTNLGWLGLRACIARRFVQCHGGANERLQRPFIDLVALMKIDGASGVAFEAGVEEA